MKTTSSIQHLVRALTLAAVCAATGAVQAQATVDPAELQAARAELEQAREQLQRATRALEQLTGRPEGPRFEFRSELFGQHEDRPVIGIVMSRAPGEGVRLSAVTPGGPAAEAGLKSGDLIVAIDGRRLDGRDPVAEAREALAGMTEGDRFMFTVRHRSGSGQRDVEIAAAKLPHSTGLDVTVGEATIIVNGQARRFGVDMDDLQEELERVRENLHVRIPEIRFGASDGMNVWRWGFGWAGLELAGLNAGLGRYFGVEEGALVLDAQGLADGDLLAGDVIVAVSGRAVSEPREAMRELRRLEPGEEVDVQVVRDGRPIDIRLTSPESPGNAFFYEFQTGEADHPHEADR